MQLLTEKEVAGITKISLSKLRQDRIYRRGLPYIKIGKAVRYSNADIENFLANARIEHPAQ